MRTVINKKLLERQMTQKVKGRTFYLLLSLQESGINYARILIQ